LNYTFLLTVQVPEISLGHIWRLADVLHGE